MWTMLARDFLENELKLVQDRKLKRLKVAEVSRVDSGIFERQIAVIVELIENIENDLLHVLLKQRLYQIRDKISQLQELGAAADFRKLRSAREEKETLTELFKRWLIRLEQDQLFPLTNILN
jgi:hypothetical protein